MTFIPYNNRYKFELGSDCYIQLAFKVEHNKYVQQIISNLSKKVIGLHMQLDKKSDKILYNKSFPPTIRIGNFKSLEKATLNFAINHKLDPSTRLGAIGYNDNMVILNISHSVGDGGYFKYLTENIFNEENEIPSHFPYEVRELLPEQFKKSPDELPFWDNNPYVNRITTSNPSKLYQTNEVSYSTFRIPVEKLQCYDLRDRCLHSFTDSLWSSFFVSSIVHANKINKNNAMPNVMCIPTCTDFRRYLNGQNYSICCLYATVFPRIKVEPSDTLAKIGKSMKIDLQKRMSNGEDFGILKTIENISRKKSDNTQKKPIQKNSEDFVKKVGIELTYVGAVKIKPPINDLFMNLNMNAKYSESILSLMGFSCVGKKNEVILRLRYSPTTMFKEEVKQISDNIEYVLTKVPQSTSLSDAVRMLSDRL